MGLARHPPFRKHLHTGTSPAAIQEAVAKGKVSDSRYDRYVGIWYGEDEE
jgi:hypothetical protein